MTDHEEFDMAMKVPIEGMKALPYGWPLMAGAYMGLLQFLITQPEAREAFKADTGMDVTRALGFGVSPLDRMVDKATGHDKAVVAAFADWVTETQWGDGSDPDEPEPTARRAPSAAGLPSGLIIRQSRMKGR